METGGSCIGDKIFICCKITESLEDPLNLLFNGNRRLLHRRWSGGSVQQTNCHHLMERGGVMGFCQHSSMYFHCEHRDRFL